MTATPAADGDSPPPATEAADTGTEPEETAHPTGQAQADDNIENESPG